ncbi:aminotransferase class I/II-fold pyridoxal phosphate-dependent enzyme [Vibrio nitrifigilis]|uniref:Aminotransferase class I/II-fold pyridoxal phosphate-dependent enzyme n=1 Tax=Vibrio nitrifigilis TaxID=2789781 RepID=A0ABS0GKZ7_9VIBR|nr:aminotransferase class I/II-fold pyridoxal phosphate-dependent enzyme [Vibrio nitrifigilis]MBF9003131.1 aminotransferase class I/II-fold pyridoxal phosphate-dependent enzyme [Vibrio nitrifigilis]
MDKDISVKEIANELKGLSIQEMVIEMTALIRSGALEIGSKLPSVRALAEELGMSPASVSSVWSTLKKNNLISGSGRNGVWISGNNPAPRPLRFENVGNFGKKTKVDLTYASPDPDLLPNLDNALLSATKSHDLNSYRRELITPELKHIVAQRWPYDAEAYIATNGGFDALQATISSLIQPGTWVAVEDPTSARILDLVENIGARVISIECDEQGPTPYALTQALEHKVSAFIYQPRVNSVTGVNVTKERLKVLEPLVADIPLVIEDDGIGDISATPTCTFAHVYPDKVVHIRTYSKSLGPDLRLAVLSAPKSIAKSIQAYRNFGASWTSRLLQNAAAYLLNDPQVIERLSLMRECYRQRRDWLTQALEKRNIAYEGENGFSVWIPVPSEQFALVTLAVHGYAVFAGSRFMTIPKQPHIRVTTSLLKEEMVDALADVIQMCFDVE